jgi:hypothetical protein
LPDDSRQLLARKQSELADALAGKCDVPTGFDAERVELASRMLLHKRRQAVAHVIPRVVDELGRRFIVLFEDYARSFPHPPAKGAAFDALEFSDWLGWTTLSNERGIELARLDLSIRRRARSVRLKSRKLLGFRLPIVGVRMIGIPVISGSKTPSCAGHKSSAPEDQTAADGVR